MSRLTVGVSERMLTKLGQRRRFRMCLLHQTVLCGGVHFLANTCASISYVKGVSLEPVPCMSQIVSWASSPLDEEVRQGSRSYWIFFSASLDSTNAVNPLRVHP